MTQTDEPDVSKPNPNKPPGYLIWLFCALLGTVGLIKVWNAPCPEAAIDGKEIQCETRGEWFAKLAPNEQGDTLAGVAGSLAFLGILATILLQGRELRAQRIELELARKAQEKTAKALDAQASIFLDEKKFRDETRSKNLLLGYLDAIKLALNSITNDENVLTALPTDDVLQKLDDLVVKRNNRLISSLHPRGAFRSGDSLHAPKSSGLLDPVDFENELLFFSQAQEYFSFLADYMGILAESKSIVKKSPHKTHYQNLRQLLLKATDLWAQLPADQQIRVDNLRLKSLEQSLDELLQLDVWDTTK